MFSIAVGAGEWIGAKSAGDAENGSDLESSEKTHKRAWVGVGRGVLRVVEIRTDEP